MGRSLIVWAIGCANRSSHSHHHVGAITCELLCDLDGRDRTALGTLLFYPITVLCRDSVAVEAGMQPLEQQLYRWAFDESGHSDYLISGENRCRKAGLQRR